MIGVFCVAVISIQDKSFLFISISWIAFWPRRLPPFLTLFEFFYDT